ncbi:MAG TPA: hypothetical protein PKA80_15050 [Ignavibacteriaceae bacterium]|nr:hypothetical protein [Ignavibacteriaceae bacterium]
MVLIFICPLYILPALMRGRLNGILTRIKKEKTGLLSYKQSLNFSLIHSYFPTGFT